MSIEMDQGRITWDTYFLRQLEIVGSKSKDPSRKVGAIIVDENNAVVITGFNGFPIGIADDPILNADRYARPTKYDYTIHAERNCILMHANRGGRALRGTTIYTSLFPCHQCANDIIQAGIKRVVSFGPPGQDVMWDFGQSLQKLTEAGVYISVYDSEFKLVEAVYEDGTVERK